MHIKKLKVYNFRNLKNCEIELSPGINFFYGNNGQGKTNLVEALSFLSWGKSFRTNSPRELVSWDETEASVFADLVFETYEENIGISIKNGRKKAYLHGEAIKSLSEYLGKFVCISFSPSDLLLIQGAPKERRNFIDRHLTALKPELITPLTKYAKALKNKNKLLKAGVRDYNAIYPWNQVLAETGSVIFIERKNFVAKLSDQAGIIHQKFGEQDGQLTLKIETELDQEFLDKKSLLSALENSFSKEMILKKSVLGPHRDDMNVYLAERKSRSFASQGQTRSIVLSLILAATDMIENVRGSSPVILLDDVDSELDPERSKRFFELMWKQNRQICITGTSPRVIPGSFKTRPKFFEINNGKVFFSEEKSSAKSIAIQMV